MGKKKDSQDSGREVSIAGQCPGLCPLREGSLELSTVCGGGTGEETHPPTSPILLPFPYQDVKIFRALDSGELRRAESVPGSLFPLTLLHHNEIIPGRYMAKPGR